MIGKKPHITLMLSIELAGNLATLDVINSSLDTVISDPKDTIGILDFRSI